MNLSKFFWYSHYDDAVYVTYELIRCLNVKVTVESVSNELLQHPDYPSLLSISDTLHIFGINNFTAELPFGQLIKISSPFLALTKNKLGAEEPVLIRKIHDNELEFLRSTDRKIARGQFIDFIHNYQGIALIPDKPVQSAENNYKEKFRMEKAKAGSMALALMAIPVLIAAAALLSLYLHGSSSLPFFLFGIIAVAGCATSAMLAVFEHNQYDRFVNKFCSSGKSIDCAAVINSPASRIAGLSWSSIGFSYFSGQMLLLLFLSGTGFPLKYIFGIFSALAVPYPVFSIIYQKFFVRQWCALCLVVQTALISQFAISVFSSWMDTSEFLSVFTIFPFTGIIIAAAFAIPAVFYYFSFANISARRRMNHYRYELSRLKHDPAVFATLVNNQSPVDLTVSPAGIQIGNENAKVKLLMVCSPYCRPCANAHITLHSVLQSGLAFQLNIVFLTGSHTTSTAQKTIRHLLAACYEKSDVERQQILHEWFLQPEFDYADFSRRFPVAHELSEFDAKVEAMSHWCAQANIHATPTFFIDGYRLPKSYFAEDLKYYLMRN